MATEDKKVTKKYIFYQFVGGIFSGLGGVVGATIVFALLIFILSKMELVPIIGDFAAKVVSVVEDKTDKE